MFYITFETGRQTKESLDYPNLIKNGILDCSHLMRSFGPPSSALQMDHASLLKQFEHLDPHNQNTFEAKDLELLISAVSSAAVEESVYFYG